MRANERAMRSDAEIDARLARIWDVMQACVQRGFAAEGILPGGLKVPRRAPRLKRGTRRARRRMGPVDPIEWVNAWALAVNEENAAGGQVVTAPTNGAAGIVPAVLHYYAALHAAAATTRACAASCSPRARSGSSTSANASISGAEMGCQGEVGVACSMAAAGLAAALGGSQRRRSRMPPRSAWSTTSASPATRSRGLVQIPCIERNAMGAVKAINAARLALRGDGTHKVSLDQVIATMRQTGYDMKSIYKETSQGGLAVNVPEC